MASGEAAASDDALGQTGKVEVVPDGAGHGRQRIEKFVDSFTNKKQKENCTFGVPLVTLLHAPRCRSAKIPASLQVPEAMVVMIDFLMEHGLEEEGLFRKNAVGSQIDQVQAAFDCAPDSEVDLSDFGVDAVGGALKRFLGELPDPLIPKYMNDFFLQCQLACPKGQSSANNGAMTEEAKNAQLAGVVADLPKLNRETLKYLCSFLVTLEKSKETTRMTADALGVVFAPALFSFPEKEEESLVKLQSCKIVIARFIKNYQEVFGEPPMEIIRLFPPKESAQSPSFQRNPSILSRDRERRRAKVWDRPESEDEQPSLEDPKSLEPQEDGAHDKSPEPQQIDQVIEKRILRSTKRQHEEDKDRPAKSTRRRQVDYV